MVVGVRDETQGDREATEQQRPGVQVDQRLALAEADAVEAMVEVVGVGDVDLAPVLHALEDDEGRVQERHGEDDQRDDQREDRLGLDRALDRDAPEQEAEQVRTAVAHVDRGRREVVHQEPGRGAGGASGEDGGVALIQVEGDDRERRRGDRADAGRQTVDAVGEVDDVHHRDEADDRHGTAGRAEVNRAEERERDVGGLDPADHGDDRRRDLAEQLDRGMQVEAVVDRADERDQRRADQDADEAVVGTGRGLDEQQSGDERAREDRQATEQRRGLATEATGLGLVDRPDASREACRQRRQNHGHGERGDERVDRIQLRHRRRGYSAARRARLVRDARPARHPDVAHRERGRISARSCCRCAAS